MCTGPLYSGWICAWYWSRNLSCRSEGLWVSTNMCPPLLYQIEEFLVLPLVDAIAVIVVGKLARPHVGGVRLQARHRDLREVGVALGELRLEVGERAQEIVGQQDLPVGARACADADGGDLELAGDDRGDLRRHRLEFQHEAARVLDRERVLEDLHG